MQVDIPILFVEINNSNYIFVAGKYDDDQNLNTCDESSYVTTTSGSVLKDFYLNPRDPIDGGNHNHKAYLLLS